MANVYMVIAALAIGGWLAVYLVSRRGLEGTRAGLCGEFQRQIDSLTARVAALERTDGEARAAIANAVAAPANEQAPATKRAAGGPVQGQVAEAVPAKAGLAETLQAASANDEVTPEVLRELTQTASALLGRKVRICSVRRLRTPDPTVNVWARQGRVVIQASHDIAQRRPE